MAVDDEEEEGGCQEREGGGEREEEPSCREKAPDDARTRLSVGWDGEEEGEGVDDGVDLAVCREAQPRPPRHHPPFLDGGEGREDEERHERLGVPARRDVDPDRVEQPQAHQRLRTRGRYPWAGVEDAGEQHPDADVPCREQHLAEGGVEELVGDEDDGEQRRVAVRRPLVREDSPRDTKRAASENTR
eukprot:CAMPEP_0180271212 /NCGR_PEP_ID=MMETSP0988-20121125/3591_1 /TAXON_ID=697907 /ORGANISM="non described non described, Strain CCMP2293" /LENGTH=187 /DNA_ID=CAMNT_0022242201 /DNA_START=726 /DNA_END=1289 /DNA_ORIENTATION=+